MPLVGWVRFFFGIIVEVLLALCIYGIWASISSDGMERYINGTFELWVILTTTMFVGGLAVWGAFVSVSSAEFGEWLHAKGRLGAYNTTYVISCATFFVTTCLLISLAANDWRWMRHFAVWSLLYSLINIYSVVVNTRRLVILHAAFRSLLREALSEGK